MDRFAALTGRQYHLFDYFGAPDAERVMVLMGSGALAAEECVDALMRAGRKGGHRQCASVPAVFRGRLSWTPCLPRCAPSPCWTGPRSRAAPASRCIWIVAHRALHEAGRGSSGFAASSIGGAATAWPAKNSRRPWPRRYSSELVTSPTRASISWSASTTTSRTAAWTYDPRVLHRRSGNRARRLLWSGRGRHGGREQEFHQDHRRRHRQLRAGIFRLRFQEIRRDDHFASALRAASRSAPAT